MAKIEDNAKRRSNEMDEQSVTSIPPKKRFLSRASSPDEEDQDEPDIFKEPLEAFRKDAIMRQWKDYMRSVKRWKNYVEQAESHQLQSQDHLRLWEDSFKKLQTFFSNMIQEGLSNFGQHSSSSSNNAALDKDKNDLERLLQEDWASDLTPHMLNAYKNKDYKDLTISKLNQLVESWITKRENITAGFESVFENGSLQEIKRDHQHILSSWAHGQRSLQDLRHRYKLSNFKYLFLSEELRILNNRLEITESNLRQAQLELEKTETSAKDEDTQMKDVGTSNSVAPQQQRQQQQQAAAAIRASNSSVSTPATEGIPPSNSQGPSSSSSPDPLIHAQQVLEQKLHEIESLKESRIGLKQSIARLEMDLICVPESRIYRATICKQLDASRKYHKDRCKRISGDCHDLQYSIDELSGSRRLLIQDLDAEQVNHFRGLEEQLSKLDVDLTRIRGQRDALVINLEQRKSSLESGRASIAELKIIADTRKERVNYLETEVLRLQKKMAARTGVKEYYELLLNSDGREALLLPSQNELKRLEDQLEQTKSRVYQEIPKESLDRQLEQISEVKQLELDVAAFEAKYGFHPSLATNDTQVEQILQDRIEKERLIISESNEKISNLEATEKQLLSEIESVSRAYADLEEENVEKVRELAAMEDEILALQLEKTKYHQTFTALNKSKDAHAMVARSLEAQSNKQLGHIQKLHERERNLQHQVTALDREYTASKAVYEIYKQRSDEAKVTLDELKTKTDSTKDKIVELQDSILDKIRLIEEGAHTRLRLEESTELLRRKVDSTNRVERPAEMKLRREREEYRSLLNCSNCRTRLKSHIILKCMHTFCKECLDSTKRCPGCDDSFNASDVKQFYF